MVSLERDNIYNTTRRLFRKTRHKTENVGQNCERVYTTANSFDKQF